jgi:hypothetical protein
MAKAKSVKIKAKKAVSARTVTAPSGSQADYDAFLPTAQKLPAAAIITLRADPALALHNVQIGVSNVLAEEARLAELPETDVKTLAALPRVALAVVFATTQVSPALSSKDLLQKLADGAALRRKLLKAADSLAESGFLKPKEVDDIRAGTGKIDAAHDLVQLAALFLKNTAKIRGKHAITVKEIKDASETGTSLLKTLKPGRARPAKATPAIGVAERDRLWTLLVQGHDALWRAGAYLFGRHEVDDKVPSLQANRGGRPKTASKASAKANGSKSQAAAPAASGAS